MPKKKGSNQELEKISRNKLDNCFSGWIVNELKDEDHGLDFKVRFTEPPSDFPASSAVQSGSKENSGQEYRDVMPVHFFVQLKATRGKFDGNQMINYQLEVDLIETFWRSESPVIIMLYEEETETFYWRVLQEYFHDELEDQHENWRNQDTVKIEIERSNSFSANLRESDNPEELVKFANSIFQTRLKIARRFNNRMRPKEGLQEFDRGELSDLSEDLILKGIFAKLKVAQKYSDDGKEDFAQARINRALELLDVEFYSLGLTVGRESIFDLSDLLFEARNLAKEVDNEEILDRLDEIDDELHSEIRIRFDGTIWRSKKLGESFEILRVEDWAYGTTQHFWVAIIQWEDGTFWDESIVAIQNREKYQQLGMREHRAEDRVLSCEHDFNDGVKCEKCDLTARSINYLGGEKFIKCDECGNKVPEDKVEEVEDYLYCKECREKFE